MSGTLCSLEWGLLLWKRKERKKNPACTLLCKFIIMVCSKWVVTVNTIVLFNKLRWRNQRRRCQICAQKKTRLTLFFLYIDPHLVSIKWRIGSKNLLCWLMSVRLLVSIKVQEDLTSSRHWFIFGITGNPVTSDRCQSRLPVSWLLLYSFVQI